MKKTNFCKEKPVLVHGGDIYSGSGSYIDYSANINPLGLPEGVKKAIIESLDSCVNYPDPLCRQLGKAVAEAEGVKEDNLIFGNGAADLIFRISLALKPKKALLCAPTFAEYEMALETVGCKCDFFYLEEGNGFTMDKSFADSIEEDTDIVFLCNPNNPTGAVVERLDMMEILQRCKELDVWMIVDECFLTMTKEVSLKDQVEKYQNLFILKAFTKDYAMAGIRLGYGITGNKDLIGKLFSAGQPWAVSHIAQRAGIQAVKEVVYREKSMAIVEREREYLVKELEALKYLVYPPSANYIFFQVKNHPETFHHEMKEAGFLIRDCGNYRGLEKDNGFFRIAVKLPEDNKKLVKALEEREAKWRK